MDEKSDSFGLILNATERLLLAVALREYLGGFKNRGSEVLLSAHPTSRSVIDGIVKRLDPEENNG